MPINQNAMLVSMLSQNDGLCPILIGAKRNDADLVKLICSSALTKMDIVDKESKTALILAAEKGNVDVVRVLLQEEFMERINVEHHDVSQQKQNSSQF